MPERSRTDKVGSSRPGHRGGGGGHAGRTGTCQRVGAVVLWGGGYLYETIFSLQSAMSRSISGSATRQLTCDARARGGSATITTGHSVATVGVCDRKKKSRSLPPEAALQVVWRPRGGTGPAGSNESAGGSPASCRSRGSCPRSWRRWPRTCPGLRSRRPCSGCRRGARERRVGVGGSAAEHPM